MIKRALFNLGARAHLHPIKRECYNAAALMLGGPLWMLNPWYDYGGIRREIEVAYDRAEGRGRRVEPNRIYEISEIPRYFRLQENEENTDLRVLAQAIRNLDHYVGRLEENLAVTAMGTTCVLLSVVMAIRSMEPEGVGVLPLLFIFGGLTVSRTVRHIKQNLHRASDQLLDFIVRSDRTVLEGNIRQFRVRFKTRERLYQAFLPYKEKGLAEAIMAMPVREPWEGNDEGPDPLS